MSGNAVEVLEARFVNRDRYADMNTEEATAIREGYARWEEGRFLQYPPPVDLDGYEVTPAAGVNLVS
ncbi:MAG: hypothetical protein NUV51_11015 [Sulfuricaulis sp.]|nr:hypothetical protein [Sulfuricaulis sp.]